MQSFVTFSYIRYLTIFLPFCQVIISYLFRQREICIVCLNQKIGKISLFLLRRHSSRFVIPQLGYCPDKRKAIAGTKRLSFLSQVKNPVLFVTDTSQPEAFKELPEASFGIVASRRQ